MGFMARHLTETMRHSSWAFLLSGAFAAPALALDVALAGLLPNRAVVVINGGNPRTLSVGGAAVEGVKLISVEEGAATVEIDGKKKRLVLGAQAVSSGGSGGGGSIIHLTADARGQVLTSGSVNGAPVRFLVDTGATYVSLGATDAKRANIDATKGTPMMMSTANGQKQGWRVKLNSVKVGDVTLHEVDGAVSDVEMPFVLLGASFLQRMEMKQEGSTMTLKKRY
jgi:aspartyl protease family protein